jgi:poly(U)-specific endoribonuclease
MEHLKQDLQNMVQHCRGLPPNPTPEQLEHKVKQLSIALEKDSVTLPRRVKEIIHDGLKNHLGWEIGRNVVSNKTLFTASNLVSSLETVCRECENWSPPVQPTENELQDLASACNRLWELDAHRLIPDKDYTLNVQDGKFIYEGGDAAPDKLFTSVDEKALAKPTFAAFIALLDNYIAETGKAEVVTDEERKENMDFLNLIMDTAVMQYVHHYLIAKGKIRSTDRNDFIRDLNRLWFGLYSRKTRNDSSGFEHVFLGEIKEDTKEVTGFHNWIQLYLEEKKKAFDYRGYIKPKKRGHGAHIPHSCEQFISLQFSWKGFLKNVSSSFIGTSPEFEIALYTLCFYTEEQENIVQIGPYRVNITVHKWPANPKQGQPVYIGSSFPSEAR